MLRLGRALTWALAIVIVLFAAALAFLHSSLELGWVRDQVVSALDRTLTGSITIGRIEGNLLDRFLLRDVILYGPDGEVAARIDELILDTDLWELRHQRVAVDEIIVRGADVIARRLPDGSLNLAGLVEPGPETDEPSPWIVSLERVAVEDGTFTWIEASETTAARVTEIALDARVRTGGGRVEAELARLVGRWDRRAFQVQAEARLVAGSVIARGVDARLGDARLVAPFAYHDLQGGGLLALAALRVPAALAADLAPDLGLVSDMELVAAAARLHGIWPVWLALLASTEGGSARISGAVMPERPAARLRIQGEGVDLASVVRDLPPTLLDIDARVNAEGASLETLRAAADIAVAGTVDRTRVPGVRAQIELSEGRAQVHADVDVPGGALTGDGVVQLGGEVPVIERARVRGNLRELARTTAAAPGLPDDVAIAGTAALDLRGSGPVDALAVQGWVRGSELSWRLPGSAGALAALDLELELTGLPGRIRGQARLAAEDMVHQDTRLGDLEARVTSRAPVSADRSRVPGVVQVALAASGDDALLPLSMEATVTQRARRTDIELGRYRITTGHLVWRGRGGAVRVGADGGVRVRDVGLRSGAGAVSVSGAAIAGGRWPRRSLQVELESLDLAEIDRALARMTGSAPVPLRGTVSMHARVQQRGQRVQGELDLQGASLASGPGVPAVDLAARVALEGRALRLDLDASGAGLGAARMELALRTPRDVTDARAWQRLDESALAALDVDLAEIHLSGLRAWAPEALGAIASGTIAGTATVEDGARRARVRLSTRDVQVASVTTPLDAWIDLALEDRLVNVEGQARAGERGRAELRATAALPRRLSDPAAWQAHPRALHAAQLSATGIDLDYWLALAGAEVELGATAAFTAAVVDQGRALDLGAQVTVPADTWPGLPASRLDIASTVTPGQTTAELAARIDGAPYLQGSARVQAGLDALLGGNAGRFATAPATAELEVDALPLGLVREVAGLTVPLAGALHGTVGLAGSLSAPEAAVELRGDGVTMASSHFRSFAIQGRYGDQRLRVTVDSVQRRGGALEARADLQLGGDSGPTGAAMLRARAFDIGFLGVFVPSIELGGQLDGDLRASGTVATPVVTGRLALSRGELLAGPPLRRMRDIEVALALDTDRIILERATARSGRGRVSLQGSAELEDLMPRSFALQLESDALPLELGATLVDLTSDVRIANGRRTAAGWRADTRIRSATLRLLREQGRELHLVQTPEDVVFVDGQCVEGSSCAAAVDFHEPGDGEEVVVSAPLPPLRLTIRARDSILARSDEGRALLGADLVVDTRTGDLVISGAVVANSGYVELFGRRYQVQRALASFDTTPGSVPDPSLDILLAHEFPTLSLFIQVQGTASEPELVLRSEPGVYDEATLLSFVLGADPAAPGGGALDGQPGATLGERAVGVASSLIAGRVQSLVEDILPIDVLRVELDDAAEGAERFVVGKWITDNLFLSYSRNFAADSNENSSEAAIEYRFWRRWLLEAFYGDRGAGGIDLLWTNRF